MSISTVVSLLTLLILLALYPHDPTSIPSNAELTRSLYVSRKSSSIFTAIAQSIALEASVAVEGKVRRTLIFRTSKFKKITDNNLFD